MYYNTGHVILSEAARATVRDGMPRVHSKQPNMKQSEQPLCSLGLIDPFTKKTGCSWHDASQLARLNAPRVCNERLYLPIGCFYANHAGYLWPCRPVGLKRVSLKRMQGDASIVVLPIFCIHIVYLLIFIGPFSFCHNKGHCGCGSFYNTFATIASVTASNPSATAKTKQFLMCSLALVVCWYSVQLETYHIAAYYCVFCTFYTPILYSLRRWNSDLVWF